MSKEIFDFKIDKNILYSIIVKQAGTLQKAFLELVMNSIDAEATEIRIEFNGKEFSFYDNGKGFENEDEIHKFFGTFGTPHNDGDAVYGKFRMGRGQIMAFSQNQWKSNTFFMDVDIKNRGINYKFEANQPFVDGCLISGILYEELEPFEIKEFEKELIEFIKFSQVPIFYNNKNISDNILNIKWDKETEFGYIKIDDNKRNLSVYNLGVKIVDYSKWDIGFGGIIVSKLPIEVNFARNDILKKSCNTWKALYKEINIILMGKSKKSIEEYKNLDDSERASLSKKLITGELEYSIGRKLKLFKDVKGIYHTLSKISNLEIVAIADRYDRLADRVHDEKKAFVLDKEVLENFGLDSLENLFIQLKNRCYEYYSKKCDFFSREYKLLSTEYDKLSKERLFIEDISCFTSEINIDYNIIDLKSLTLKEKIVLETIKKHEKKVREMLNSFIKVDYRQKIREIKIGESGIAEAWTDGKTFIAIEKTFLNATYGVPSFMKICNLLLHEYIHSESDEKSHVHNAEFFEIFHRASQHHLTRYRTGYQNQQGETQYSYYLKDRKNSLGHIAFAMTKTYIGLLENNKLKVPKSLMTLSSKTYKQLFQNI